MHTIYTMWYTSLSSLSKDAAIVWAGELGAELTAMVPMLHRCVHFCVWLRKYEMCGGADEVYPMIFTWLSI